MARPHRYEALEVTKVNTYGIVLHWQGSGSGSDAGALRLPVLITAHQGALAAADALNAPLIVILSRYLDVVPVEPNTVDDWVQPPYSGYYDGIRRTVLSSMFDLC